MFPPMRIIALAIALACAGATAHAQGYSPAAKRVLDRARAATGGAGWNLLRGWHEVGWQGGARYECWIDPIRYGRREERREQGGLRVRGFNGAGDWEIPPVGPATGTGDRSVIAKARTEAFFAGHLFYFPGRYDASGEHLGVRRSGAEAYDVLSIRPWGGHARELWFSRGSHLLTRMVDRSGPWPVTVELSDYRRVGPVMVAFRYSVDDADPVGVRDRLVERLSFDVADRSVFSLPRPTTEAAGRHLASVEDERVGAARGRD